MDVYTYGGIDLLEKAFNVSAAIFQTKGFKDNLLYIAVAIGFAVALWKTVSAFSFGPLLKQFLVPVFLIFCLFTIGSKEIVIHDEILKEERTVSNVPLLLAATSSGISSISRQMIKLFEDKMHDVNDPVYNWTGRIYAGQTFLASEKPRVVDGTTMVNFQRFCKNCVRGDLGLGLYSLEELESSPRILEFLATRTSGLRTSGYRMTKADILAIGDDTTLYDGEKPKEGELRQIPCNKIAIILEKRTGEKIVAAKEFIQKNFQGDRERLSLLNGEEDTPALGNLLQQSFAIDTVKNYTYGRATAFGAAKAEMQQIEAQKISGLLSMKWIVALRNYLEAMLYLLFPWVILLTMVSLGFKTIQGWVFLIFWVNLWPPLYIAANFLLTSMFKERATSMGLLGKGYTLFTSDGIFQLNQQMEGIAFGVFATIPIFTLVFLRLAQGGATAMAHWAGGLGGFAQGAAAQAAGEVVSGNYSFDNVSLGNQQFGNRTQDQRNLAASFVGNQIVNQDVFGKTTTDAFGENPIYNQNKSSLQAGVNVQESLNTQIVESQREAASILASSSETYSSDSSHTMNATEGINRHAATNHSQNSSADGSISQQMSGMIQNAKGIATDFAQNNGITETGALEESIGASLGGKLLGTGVSGSTYLKHSYGSMDQEQKNARVNEARLVQDAYTESANFALNNREALSQEEGGRAYVDWAEQWTNTQRSSASVQKAYSETQSWDRVANESRSSGSSFNQDLTTDFDRYLLKETGDVGKKIDVLNNPHLLQGYLQIYSRKKLNTLYRDLGGSIDKGVITTPGDVLKNRVDGNVGSAQDFHAEASRRVPSAKPEGFNLDVPTGREEVFSRTPENKRGNPIDQEKVEIYQSQKKHPEEAFQQKERNFEDLQKATVLDALKKKSFFGKIAQEKRGLWNIIKDYGAEVQAKIADENPSARKMWGGDKTKTPMKSED